jgi:hypothetical protein
MKRKTARSSETTERLAFVQSVKIFEKHSAQNFKISIVFFPLQGNPRLLIPWMVYTLFFLIVNTVLYIVNAATYLGMGWAAEGTGYIIGIIIYIRKQFSV